MQILILSVTAKLKMYIFLKSVPILNIDLFSNDLSSFRSLFPIFPNYVEVITWLDPGHCPNSRLLTEGPPGDLEQQPRLWQTVPGQGEQLSHHLQHVWAHHTGGQQRLQLTGTVQCTLWLWVLCQPPSNPCSWGTTLIELTLSSELQHQAPCHRLSRNCGWMETHGTFLP